MTAPVRYLGLQRGIPGKVADTLLFNLLEDIPGHPKGSTVSKETLEKAGYEVPEKRGECKGCGCDVPAWKSLCDNCVKEFEVW